jgi:hypothetical protein
MMIRYFFAISFSFFLSALSFAQEVVKFPAVLSCQSLGNCIAGHPNFCEASTYFPAVIEQPEAHAAEVYDPSGVLTEEEISSKIMLDFTNGDQYSFYFFNAADMKALTEGQLSSIQGTYEDGFDWVNGYNTRAKFNIECKGVR